MPTKLIRLDYDVLIEVEVPGTQLEPLSGGVADRVTSTLDQVRPIIEKVCRPVVAAWRELNREMFIEEAEIELGLSFEGEGNIYVTKTKAAANLTITLKLRPAGQDDLSH